MRLSFDVAARFTAPGAEPFDLAVDLDSTDGETLVVLGPSGSGKTLLLETLGGFHAHDGAVAVDGEDLTDVPPERRGFGFVFQDHALFPHLTARENVAFGTRYHPDARDPDEVLSELGIVHLAERTPATLSGGEAQRVALARSLAIRPSVLLLDEPLSALDVPTRESLRTELASVLEDVTAVYVTHDRTTARELGDRIAVMREGRLVQVGTPEAVFERPATPFVARFTGANCVPAGTWSEAVEGERRPSSGGPGSGPPAGRERPGTGGDATWIGIRPEHVVLGEGGVSATVANASKRDVVTKVLLAREGDDGDVVEAYTTDPPAVGAETTVRFPGDRVVWFPREGDRKRERLDA